MEELENNYIVYTKSFSEYETSTHVYYKGTKEALAHFVKIKNDKEFFITTFETIKGGEKFDLAIKTDDILRIVPS